MLNEILQHSTEEHVKDPEHSENVQVAGYR